MAKQLSGKQKAESYYTNFIAWKDAQTDDDFREMVNIKDGVLARKSIAKACD